MSSIFTKIINQTIPSYKVFEDDLSYAFLDIHPINLGHTLIVPKVEITQYMDLPAQLLERIFFNGQTLSKAIQKATNSEKVGLIVDGWGVPDHFHLHLVPTNGPGEIYNQEGKKFSDSEMLQIQKKIIESISNSV